MMFSTKGRYALRVMIDLAEHYSGEYIPIKDVATRQEISFKYIERIMPELKKNDLIETVHGKGGKTRMVPISESLCKRLAAIMTAPDEPIFKTGKGSKMYPRLVYRIVHKYLEKAQAVSQSSPHTLRHSFATAMLNNGAPIEAIKELLGHANLTATQIYTHTTYEKLNKIYKQAHPRA